MQHSHVSRAKLFLPFDSLKGFKELLKAKERIIIEQKELLDDRKNELDYIFQTISIGDLISVIHYDQHAYIKTTGMISHIDEINHCLTIVKKVIDCQDIYDIEIIKKKSML